ncbi:hypothetical protein [Imhoffiella purpurea]|nr:hypothetical protein [Imhoffiella purpurea]
MSSTHSLAKIGACLLTAGTLSLATMAHAQTLPVAGAAASTTLTGTVTVVNVEKRLLTIKTEDGRFEVLRVPPEVTRLDQIKIGNTLTVTQTKLVLIDLVKGVEAAGIGIEKDSAMIRDPGSKPSGAIVDTVTLKGVVESVDQDASTVTIRGPQQVRTFEVEDPALLNSVVPGDGVTVTYATIIDGGVTFE